MELTAYICTTCGVQYHPSVTPPEHCPICEDERQYVNPKGQTWTTLKQVNQQHENKLEEIARNIYAIYTTPAFGIGQRAHLILSQSGNILWDCITNLDDATIEQINNLGGIKAIALSHPHYYSTIVEWIKAFGNIPIYIHEADQQWLGRKTDAIILWKGKELELWDGIKLICSGGHFDGACVLYNPAGKGSLLVGDTIQVSPDLKTVSFMYSYPNLIPLPKKAILNIAASVQNCDYDSMYGAFGKYIFANAKAAMKFSVDRYLKIFE